MTVLIADDHAPLRETLRQLLEIAGHDDVLEARDGEEALVVLQESSVDVLVLDLHMPKRDGFSVLRELHSSRPLVIVLSAFEYVEPEDLGEQAGARLFKVLRKPVSPKVFLSVVDEAVEESRAQD